MIFDNILNWIYPLHCISCGGIMPLNENKRFFCAPCEELLVIAKPESGATFEYNDILKETINKMKFTSNKRIAAALGEIWALYYNETLPQNHEIIPMPIHPAKLRERGFNQAEIMVRPLAKAANIPITHALIRTRDTLPQSEVHASQRAANVKNAFALRGGTDANGKNYILADDILTTGASLNECAKVLKKHGAANVICITFAVTVKKTPTTADNLYAR